MNIAEYISTMAAEGTLAGAEQAAIKDYESHKDYQAVTTWHEVLADAGKSKGADLETDDADETEDFDYVENSRWLRSFFKAHKIHVLKSKKTKTHVFAYVECPWCENHTSEENETSTFVSIDKRPGNKGMINFHCNHNHCDDKRWSDFRKFYEARDGTQSDPETSEDSKRFEIELVSGRDLQRKVLPPIIYPIDNMIPEGYTVISAPFKYGKSWYALEMCLAVASGEPFLGQKTTKGSTVYLALEDCDKFAQERLNIALCGAEAPEGFYYIYNKVPSLDDGFIEYLNQLYEKVADLKLIVIDVLAIVEYQTKRGESAYKCDYRTGTALKQWADTHNTAVIAITHTTKMIHPNDVFMNTTGTNGVTGSADAIITIAKEKRTDKDAVLAITGRRVREKYFRVRLKGGYLWETDGEVDPETMQADVSQRDQEQRLEDYRSNEIREAVIAIANTGTDDEMCSKEILNRARDLGIYLLKEPKEIGGFICKYENYFMREDGIKVYVRGRGSGSNLYKFKVWEPADEETETIFDAEV